jgi:ribose-phosphate pyrophosphokinase
MALTIEEVVILADPKGLCYPFAQRVYRDILERPQRDFSIRLVAVSFPEFSDGEKKARVEENVRKRECYYIHDGNKKPATWLAELGMANNALNFADAGKIIDVIPYFMFARQDRKDEPRVSITTKEVADAIQKYGDGLMTVDLHNLAITGSFDIPIDNLGTFPVVINYIKDKHPNILKEFGPYRKKGSVMSPDAGGTSRCRKFINMCSALGIDVLLVMGDKYRPQAGSIDGSTYRLLGNVRRSNVLIVDDMYASGGTMITASKEVRNRGARKVYGYATHPLFTNGARFVARHFDLLMTSDTRYCKPMRGLEVISVAPLVAEAIYRRIRGESISDLSEIKKH